MAAHLTAMRQFRIRLLLPASRPLTVYSWVCHRLGGELPGGLVKLQKNTTTDSALHKSLPDSDVENNSAEPVVLGVGKF
jgi:hypothetical protein